MGSQEKRCCRFYRREVACYKIVTPSFAPAGAVKEFGEKLMHPCLKNTAYAPSTGRVVYNACLSRNTLDSRVFNKEVKEAVKHGVSMLKEGFNELRNQ